MQDKCNLGVITKHVSAGIAEHNQGNIEAALKHYHHVLELDPNHPAVNHNLGLIEANKGNLSEALKQFQKAIEVEKNNVQYFTSLIGIYLKIGNAEQAKLLFIEAYARGLQSDGLQKLANIFRSLDPNIDLEFEGKITHIIKLYSEGLFHDALSMAKNLLADYPDHPTLLNFCGLCTAKSGKFDLSYGFYTKAVKMKLDFAEAYNNRGLLLFNHQKFELALNDLKRALALEPNYSKANNNLGLVYFALGQYQRAISHYRTAIDIEPDYVIAYVNLANCYKVSGQVQNAKETYELAIIKNPHFPEAYINFAELLSTVGEIELALENLNKAIDLNPNIAAAHFNLGNVCRKIGDHDAAIDSYKNAISLDKTHTRAYNNLGLALKDKRQYHDAINALQQALKFNPKYSEAYNNLGNVQKLIGNIDEARSNYENAIKFNPTYEDSFLNIFEILEKSNQVKELELWISKAKNVFVNFSDEMKLYQIILYYRLRDFELAREVSETINSNTITDTLKPALYNVLGKIAEKLGHYERAFHNFDSMNRFIEDSEVYKNINRVVIEKFCSDRLATLSRKNLLRKDRSHIDTDDWAPVFIIGFPRSGTTLLDTVLRSHRRIIVIEEKEMLSSAIESISSNVDYINNFPTSAEREQAKAIYSQELLNHVNVLDENYLYIDKLPLNMLKAPEISFLYPAAKFIWVMRHPLDSILSNWTQVYTLNPAMAQMTNLKSIVNFYHQTINIFEKSAELFDIDFHMIKYENLVFNFQNEVQSVLDFLSLDWDPSLIDFHITAQRRKRINTPSYDQVIQPLYGDAIGRWKHYEKHFEPFNSTLNPIINKFGY